MEVNTQKDINEAMEQRKKRRVDILKRVQNNIKAKSRV